MSSSEIQKITYWKRIRDNIIVIALPIVMVFLLGPLEIFAGNASEFNFGTKDFVWIFLTISVVLIGVMSAILALLPEQLLDVVHILIFAFSIMAYIQNMFLNKQLIKTDGSRMDWSEWHDYSLINAVIWIAGLILIVVVCFLLRHNRDKVIVGVSACLTLVQIIAAVSILLTNPYSTSSKTMYALDGKDEFTLGSEDNVIVLILDRYSNKLFENGIEKDSEFDSVFKDFTYYDNANSKYNYTFPSIPYMMTHVEPDCSITTSEYKEQAWTSGLSDDFHDDLATQGFKVNLYTGSDRAIFNNAMWLQGSFDNVAEIENANFKIDRKYMVSIFTKTSIFKYAPYVVKPYLDVLSYEFDWITSYDGVDSSISENYRFYELLQQEGLNIGDDTKRFSMIHLTGVHNPLNIDENGNYSEEEDTDLYKTQLGLNVILAEYFDQLKELDLYDSSTIIIMADHGQYLEERDPQPIFLIKRVGDSNLSMKVNSAPISSEDFLATILDIENLPYDQYGTSIYDWNEADERVRQSCYPDDGFRVYEYNGTTSDLCDKFEEDDYSRIDATEDWD